MRTIDIPPELAPRLRLRAAALNRSQHDVILLALEQYLHTDWGAVTRALEVLNRAEAQDWSEGGDWGPMHDAAIELRAHLRKVLAQFRLQGT